MKVQIRDKDALESLTTANLRAYLETPGWADVRRWGEWATIHSKDQDGKLWEIAIPNREDCSDYAEFMAEAVTTLADAEDRSQLDVFNDLASVGVGTVPQASHKRAESMTNVWRVGAEKGKYTNQFVDGGYAGIGWLPKEDLAQVQDREKIRRLYKETYLEDTKESKINQQVGQIYRFLMDIKPGDYVITPSKESGVFRYGLVDSDLYYEPAPSDSCPFPHRRKIDWAERPMSVSEFSLPLENALKFGVLTVFAIKQRAEFLAAIGREYLPTTPVVPLPNPYSVVLEELQKMEAREFEMFIGHVLTVLGIENSLADLLIKHWNDIPVEFRERLGLKPGLVPA